MFLTVIVVIISLLVLLFVTVEHIVKFVQFRIYGLDYDQVLRKPQIFHYRKDQTIGNLISKTECSKNHIALLILITSHPYNIYRRETIRKTWGSYSTQYLKNDFRTFFVSAKVENEIMMSKFYDEVNKYKDILLGNFYENFYNLSLKVDISLEWSYKHCSFDYLLKADDDVFVNLPLLFSRLPSHKNERLYLGYCYFYPYVKSDGKYRVNVKEYNQLIYPNYCAGGAFIFDYKAIKSIVPYIFQKQFKIDDVYIGMLAYNAKLQVTHDSYFLASNSKCQFKDNYIALHPAKQPTCMKYLFSTMISKNLENEFVKLYYMF